MRELELELWPGNIRPIIASGCFEYNIGGDSLGLLFNLQNPSTLT